MKVSPGAAREGLFKNEITVVLNGSTFVGGASAIACSTFSVIGCFEIH